MVNPLMILTQWQSFIKKCVCLTDTHKVVHTLYGFSIKIVSTYLIRFI